ncbi:MerR family transcriptional regulator [Saccharopolyspora gregorii]|uniref:helix-turn-helix domain-containing protein n=1 Tax=Saccharopolyspora gregorii TaxID=33914 RepID=UPI0021ABB75B|nr:MerR family transcriptional regulator [Saccharopolyspora gregorii]
MGWSTREIAELAGTTLRAVRHYHDVGLLDEPERGSNGYKKYGVAHLLRVLRIKRLTELGFSLAQVAEMGADDEHPAEALRALDADLAATIERLQRARVELGIVLNRAAPAELPPDLAPGVRDLSDADRNLVVVVTRVLGPEGMRTYAKMLENLPQDPAADEFDALPADADEATRADLAERMKPYVRALRALNPDLTEAHEDAPGGPAFARRTVGKAVAELYNAAQLDVLRRVGPEGAERRRDDGG